MNWFKRAPQWETIWFDTRDWQIANYNKLFGHFLYYSEQQSRYEIQKRENEYRLNLKGYKPEEHSDYRDIFNQYRGVVEGTIEIKAGEMYEKE